MCVVCIYAFFYRDPGLLVFWPAVWTKFALQKLEPTSHVPDSFLLPGETREKEKRPHRFQSSGTDSIRNKNTTYKKRLNPSDLTGHFFYC